MATNKRLKKNVQSPVIGFIGAGNMATALIKGIISANLFSPAEIAAFDVDGRKRAAMRRRFGIHMSSDNQELVRHCKIIVLAVKPQIMDIVLEEFRSLPLRGKLFVSIAAGISTRRLESGLGAKAKVLRVMPNTPSLIGEGMAAIACGRYATKTDLSTGLKILRAVGDAVALSDEKLIDAVTGLSGSGPAYVYRFAEGMIAGGIATGLPQDLAERFALQTIAGASAMLKDGGASPETLRAQVSSPGGTTVAGLAELEKRSFHKSVIAAVKTATKRSKELGRSKQ